MSFSYQEDAIKLSYADNQENILHPNIVENIKDWQWKNEKPLDCPNQGYFYEYKL